MPTLMFWGGPDPEGTSVEIEGRDDEGLLAVGEGGQIVGADETAHALFGVPFGALRGTRLDPQVGAWRATLNLSVLGAMRTVEAWAEPATSVPEGLLLIRLRDASADGASLADLRESLQERDRLLAMGREMRLAQLSVLEDQMKAQEALRESERFLWATLDGLAAHIAILDEEGHILAVNRAWREFAAANDGDPETMSEGANYLSVCEQAGQAGCSQGRAFAEGIRQVLSGAAPDYVMEYPCDSPDQVRRFVARVTPFRGEGPRRVVIAHENITERVLAEEALRESEQHFRNLADTTSTLIWTSGPDGACDYFNRPWLAYRGRTLEQDLGDGWLDGVHPEDAPAVMAAYRAAFEQRKRFTVDFRLARHDGVYRWFEDDGSPRYDSQGRFSGYIGYLFDITERKLAEARVEHLNGVLRAIRDVNQMIVRVASERELVDGAANLLGSMAGYASCVLILVDAEDRPTAWASRGDPTFEQSVDAMLGQGALPRCCAEARARAGALLIEEHGGHCHGCPLADVQSARNSLWSALRHEDVVYGYLGVQTSHGMGIDDEEQGLVTEIAGDVAYALRNLALTRAHAEAERVRATLEQQLQHAQRVEAVGRLAGGVAHDFNNMLSVILGSLELAIPQLPPDHPVLEDLREAERAGRRSADLTRQLLAFARQQTISPRVVDLNEALEGMLKMLRRLIGEDIEVVWRPHTRVWPVHIDPSQLDQVLANLAVNARDAIGGAGIVTIETDNVTLTPEEALEKVGASPGDYVRLSVSDTGVGMSDEVRAHLFEPFFTTKPVGEGTGLGLATIYGVVTQNNGVIEVDSALGQGTTFRIYIPRHAEAAAGEAPAAPAETPRGAGELVLLVEDEGSILQMGTRMLRMLGYDVLATSNPREVAALMAAEERTPALLITDVVMPGLNGHDLADQLRTRYPDLRVLYMSGYTADVIARQGVLDEGVNFVGKPFTLRMLGEAVSQAMQVR